MMRLGIVGCGLIGQKRAASVGAHEVAYVADLNGERARALASQLPSARVVSDWRAVVDSDAEAIVVATTHDNLAPIALAAVQNGKHVLLEKPAARSAHELEPLVAAAKDHRVIVKVGFNHRFHPALQRAKQIVDAGELGPLLFIRGRYGHGGRVGYEREWRCEASVSGGGQLIDQGSHLIDLSRWFLGDFQSVEGSCATYFWDIQVDDNCFLNLTTSKGQRAWLHASWTEWKNLFSFEIFGRVGKLQIDGLGGSYGTERLTFYKMHQELGPPETTAWEYPSADRSWHVEFADFEKSIAHGSRPCGDLHDALAMLRIVGQVYSSKKGRHEP